MEQIVLEVDDQVAKAWRISSNKLKKEISTMMNKQLATIMKKKEEKDFITFLDELGKEVAEKGLTQDILDEILKDED